MSTMKYLTQNRAPDYPNSGAWQFKPMDLSFGLVEVFRLAYDLYYQKQMEKQQKKDKKEQIKR